MRVILNYKSLYEAVKVGVTNDGYTPVTRMLFFPVFDPKGDIQPCDENGVPYEVDTKNANAWCKGEDNIPKASKQLLGRNLPWKPLSIITNRNSSQISYMKLPKTKCMRRW